LQKSSSTVVSMVDDNRFSGLGEQLGDEPDDSDSVDERRCSDKDE
jgi:hypothetical protein